jgi:hypothetical protein
MSAEITEREEHDIYYYGTEGKKKFKNEYALHMHLYATSGGRGVVLLFI